ncbi:hypothetical protein KC19_8G086500 [Ceratodon purpureus]|uniref:tRNA (guanine(37)-N1)-methyltransferase n=1 Tax=Ceratodon purpureus TaxID=3225 RepID=A0A8T0GWK1_CERPU|nr:hypothetical protein KC19_8G086500 [Ceratodon purpureus]
MAAPGLPPPALLDKSRFVQRLPRAALRIPKHRSHLVASLLSSFLLDMPRVKHIVPDPRDPSMRLLLLSPRVTLPGLEGLPEEKKLALANMVPLDIIQHDVVLDYSYWPVEHILKEILPAGCEVPSSFETIGHIAHLNLRDDLLPYKKVIAEVILDKNPKLKTVVNKVGTITNEFRVPEFEVLAGDPSLVTEIKQHGATFRLDYGLVYWNSRLEGEHKRLFAQFKPGQIVVDMFAGIGPFAIPAAQQGCVVFANDLNPTSVKYLKLNSQINKVGDRVKAFNMDARDFMRKLVTEEVEIVGESAEPTAVDDSIVHNACNLTTELINKPDMGKKHVRQHSIGEGRDTVEAPSSEQGNSIPSTKKSDEKNGKKVQASGFVKMNISEIKPWERFDHIVMNLPASALEFLDVLNGLLSKDRWKGTMPQVHCYCFMRSIETNRDIIKKAETYLGSSIVDTDIYVVRDVAPNKIMLCVSFTLPEAVAFAPTPEPPIMEESDTKRPRTE